MRVPCQVAVFRCLRCKYLEAITRYFSARHSRTQGADSLEVVHRQVTPDRRPSGGTNDAQKKRGGIHTFGKCYIPYTSRENKEVQAVRELLARVYLC